MKYNESYAVIALCTERDSVVRMQRVNCVTESFGGRWKLI